MTFRTQGFYRLLASSCLLLATAPLYAQTQYAPAAPPAEGVIGFWSTDAGSVLHVHTCGDAVCITIRTISKTAPGVIDAHNPDSSLRNRPICRMDIGTGFHLDDDNHAVGGRIYDPESGKVYKSVMTSDGNELHLRGYVGFKALGRTQTWRRTTETYATCVGTTQR